LASSREWRGKLQQSTANILLPIDPIRPAGIRPAAQRSWPSAAATFGKLKESGKGIRLIAELRLSTVTSLK
jgi:hypothetical protein